jgi:uncharacterized protein (DUF362 family)
MQKRVTNHVRQASWSRRQFIKYAAAGSLAAAGGFLWGSRPGSLSGSAETFIGSASGYHDDLVTILRKGLEALAYSASSFKGKRILIKPNLVEPHAGHGHINTNPMLVRAAVELFRRMDAAEVVIAEGPGHRRDSLLVLEASGFADVIVEDRVPFFDLNTGPVRRVANKGGYTSMKELCLPRLVLDADVVVSLAKMKTHHWAGVTLSMKNFFGIMPGCVYGWPKNVLHQAGIQRSILDINATFQPHLCIVDGIVGMEGDGPIMGTPVRSNVVVMGRSAPAVDATCARVMGIDPHKIPYLKAAGRRIGPIAEASIVQRGEIIESVRKDYQLISGIPAQRHIRWDRS